MTKKFEVRRSNVRRVRKRRIRHNYLPYIVLLIIALSGWGIGVMIMRSQ